MALINGPSTQVFMALKWQEGKPSFHIREDSQSTLMTESAIGYPLFYRATADSKRFCLGHTAMTQEGTSYKICLEKPKIGRKCQKCSNADARYAANLHHSHTKNVNEVPQEFRNHMEQPNYLYLATFADGTIKIGTTTEKRKERRLREQGALWATIIAKTLDGYTVRTLEDLVTEELSIQQSVTTKKKIAGLLRPADRTEVRKELKRVSGAVEALIQKVDYLDCELLGMKWENDALENSIWENVHSYPWDLTNGPHAVKVIDVIGRIGALSPVNSSDVFIADLDALFGIEIEIGEFPREELIVQDALF